MAIPIQSSISNPVSGAFGIGQVQFFSNSGTWNVPPGIAKVRVRMWGGGGGYTAHGTYYGAGGGGGFAIKTIYDLTGVTSVAVIVGNGGTRETSGTTLRFAGTSSFGSYCSATGGATNGGVASSNIGGTGIGGDINTSGGLGWWGSTSDVGGGGGCGSIFGNGGYAQSLNNVAPSTGGAGAGTPQSNAGLTAGPGFMTNGGFSTTGTSGFTSFPDAYTGNFSLDIIGTGGGGGYGQQGVNGGGGGYNTGYGGFPGGGSGFISVNTGVIVGGGGLVIVEW